MESNLLHASLKLSCKILNQDEKAKVTIIEESGKGFRSSHNLKEIKSLKGNIY